MADDTHRAFVRLRSKTSGQWFVDPQLRPRLIADAEAQKTNMTEIAVLILCRHFNVPFSPTGRRSSANKDEAILNLVIPGDLYRALTARYGTRYMNGIRAVLCQHYGLKVQALATGDGRPARPIAGRAVA